MASNRLVYLTRRETFSAAHRLNNPDLTPEDNARIFSKCNNCHGHNYTVDITVKGRIIPSTGMVINISLLKTFIQQILDRLDHKHLDVDVPYFHNVISTTENLTIYIWDELEKMLLGLDKNEAQCFMHCVRIMETDKNVCEFRGEIVPDE